MDNSDMSNKKRFILKVMGIVQGVGYRPYVYNQANFYKIKGWVSNRGSALIVDFEGEKHNIKNFLISIIKHPPKLAIIEKIEIAPDTYVGFNNFIIKASSEGEDEVKFIATDVATCPECLREIFNLKDKRYKYAFTNCTACGPRYSIIKGLPYDRVSTTMNSFKMCEVCQHEYSDPANRRFHAQPNCCPKCGPALKLLTNKGQEIKSEDQVSDAINFIEQGKIVAIKGLGGFHLACDAVNKKAIEELRLRKNRPHKPFAIMVKDIETAHKLAYINKEEEKILLSNKRPILILNKKENGMLPNNIAPNTKRIGIMLPYTPLHYLLFQENISVLVMTSGNVSGGPIQFKDNEALEHLENIADYFLIHNREINISVEDSVVKVVKNNEIVLRAARGYTPYIFEAGVNKEILALGAEQKNTFSLSKNGYVYMSQYLGDLNNYDCYTTYEKAIDNLSILTDIKPKILAYDLHSKALLTRFNNSRVIKDIPIQHHHAHMVSCMVEHNLFKPVIGVIFDGTGLGVDGTIWGGEFFVGTRKDFTRVGHLKYVTIQGGEGAIKEPWRIALSYLHSLGYDANDILLEVDKDKIYYAKQALEKNLNCFRTSSMGRFFDCVASLLNIRHKITYDAQGAIELENIINPSMKESYDYHLKEEDDIFRIEYEDIIISILGDIERKILPSIISAKFHNTIGNITVDLVCKLSKKYNIKQVVLSGGVFQNDYLLTYIIERLVEKGLDVYFNQRIPINDSGISVGQLAIADEYKGEG